MLPQATVVAGGMVAGGTVVADAGLADGTEAGSSHLIRCINARQGISITQTCTTLACTLHTVNP